MAVEREFQDRGLGSLLIKTAIDYTCIKGKHVLTVKTYGGMDYEPYMKTFEFYKKQGFHLYEVMENYKPFEGQPAAIFIKYLNCDLTL